MSAALAVLLLGAVPAQAETWQGHDSRGDVRSFEIAAAKCDTIPAGDRQPRDQRRDITRLSVDHGVEDVVIVMSLRKVVRHDGDTSYEMFVHTPGRIFDVAVYAPSISPSGVDISTVRVGRDPECGPALIGGRIITCDDVAADVDPRTNRVTVTIPRTCLHSPRWVRVGALAGGFDQSQIGPNTARFTVTADVWGPAGSTLGELLPPSGPRVRMG